MAVLVTIDCFEDLKKIYIIFTAEDFTEIRNTWEDKTSFMPSIRNLSSFSDCESWSDLSFNQWKMLIGNKAVDVSSLSTAEQNDYNNTKVRILHFFLKALIYKLETEIGGDLEFMRVQLVSRDSMSLHWNMVDNVAVYDERPRRPSLTLLNGGE